MSAPWPPAIRRPVEPAEAVRARSVGPVVSADLFDFQSRAPGSPALSGPAVLVADDLAVLPAPGGLFCPRLFGPPGAWRADAWAHLDLPQAVAHLEFHAGRPGLLAAALALPQREVERRLRHDPDSLRAAWEALEPAALAAALEARPGTGSGPRSAAGRAAALRLAAGPAGPPFLDCLPVPPPTLRPYRVQGATLALHPLNDALRRVVNRAFRLIRLAELRAPAPILLSERRRLQEVTDEALSLLPPRES